jgi:lipopolysaccharide export system protein LptA
MKTIFALWLVLALAAGGLVQAQVPVEHKAQASPPQIPPDYQAKIFFWRDTPKGQELEFLLSGDQRTPVANRDDLITPFQLKSFRSGPSNEVQLIGRAPECHIDSAGHRAWDKGPIVLFTPTTNVWIQGEGFLFVETNHSLDISNKVETRVLRSLLKTTALNGAKTNTPGASEQMLKIFADRGRFDYESRFSQYFGHVHVIDVQLDLTSERLSIQMTTNSAIQTILAEDNVVMTTTNMGWAAGPRAFYYVTNGSEMMEITGGAEWHNGDEQAWADKFLYDSTHHFLTAVGNVRVWWPNAPQRPGAAPKVEEATGYRKMWADFATLQWPLTNGPVEAMHATGNVLVVNQYDHSSVTGDKADYVRSNDLFEVTGSPEWRNERMQVNARILEAEATNKIYHARGDSHLKLQTGSVHTNQWLYVASEDLDYSTNLAVFTDHVKARLLEDNVLRDTLNSDKLNVELSSNEVKTAIARGHVQGETAPDKFGRIKTIACADLTVNRSLATKLLTDILAEHQVVLQQFGTNASEPHDKLTAETAIAYFSPVTNQLERAVAERNVVIDQVKTNQAIHATGQRAVYTVAADEVKLTGTPVARNDQYVISNSDYMIWEPKTNLFEAFGPYHVSLIKPKPAKPRAKSVAKP